MFAPVAAPVRSISDSIKGWCWGNIDEEPRSLWTIKHGFLLEMHGLVKDTGKVVLDVDEISEHLDITEEEVDARSQSDFFTKLLATIQTTWFILQCLVRWKARLPVTELEVLTLTFALLNIAIYYMWRNKPQGMSLAIPMRRTCAQCGACKECGSSMERNAEKEDTSISIYSEETSVATATIEEEDGSPLLEKLISGRQSFTSLRECASASTVATNKMRFELLYTSQRVAGENGGTHALYFSLMMLTVGSLHLIPLWSSFPSSIEKYLWQYCTIWATIWPIIAGCLQLWAAKSQSHHRPFPDAVARVLNLSVFLFCKLLTVSYGLARYTIIVLAFTTLRNIPPDAYRNIEWTTFIPHI
jgi:hypothetical protein